MSREGPGIFAILAADFRRDVAWSPYGLARPATVTDATKL